MDYESYLDNPQQIISAELSPKEKLLWTGRAPCGLRLHANDWILIPFSLMWGGAVIGGAIGSVLKPTPIFLRIFLVPFVLVGIWLLIGRFFCDAYLRRRTFYGVTSQRIIIITGWFGRTTISMDIASLPGLALTERRNGRSIIDFTATQNPYNSGNSFPGSVTYYSSRFILDEDGRKVYDIIRTVQIA